MSKIYNEIVIDMNPQSPSFEKVIYEDSFEYSGDMLLAQGTSAHEGEKATIGISGKTKYFKDDVEITEEEAQKYRKEGNYGQKYWTQGVSIKPTYKVVQYKAGQWIETGEDAIKDEVGTHYSGGMSDLPTFVEGSSTEWGAANITKEMFINDDGLPKTIQEIYAKLDPLLPGITGDDLRNQINDMLPKYQKADETEKGFITAQEGLAGERADVAYGQAGIAAQQSKDVYGLGVSAYGRQKEAAGMGLASGLGQLQASAGQAGAQMRGAYGGMGGGMRGAIGGQATMAKGVGQAYGQYGLQMGAAGDEMRRLGQERGYAQDRYGLAGTTQDIAKRQAALTAESGIYGLDKAAGETFEADVLGAIDKSAWVAPETGAQVTPWTDDFAEGGRVPSKETFLDLLTQLPDAGGS